MPIRVEVSKTTATTAIINIYYSLMANAKVGAFHIVQLRAYSHEVLAYDYKKNYILYISFSELLNNWISG